MNPYVVCAKANSRCCVYFSGSIRSMQFPLTQFPRETHPAHHMHAYSDNSHVKYVRAFAILMLFIFQARSMQRMRIVIIIIIMVDTGHQRTRIFGHDAIKRTT